MRGVLLGCLLALAAGAWANVVLPNVFSDNMVLQRDKPIAVWGWADPGEEVSVELSGGLIGAEIVERGEAFNDQGAWRTVQKIPRPSAKTTTNAQGAWQVQLSPLPSGVIPVTSIITGAGSKPIYGEGLTLTVTGKNTLTLKNILMGDVWVCSGQSNMAFTLGQCNSPEDVAAANFPQIRHLTVQRMRGVTPQNNIGRAEGDSGWQVCTPKTAGSFSAAAFYFAREVQQRTGVPIGLINTSWGGTAIESWLPLAYLKNVPELDKLRTDCEAQLAAYPARQLAYLDEVDAWSAKARAALAQGQDIPRMPTMPVHPFVGAERPGTFVLYNAMVHPLHRFPITGALWYQGEANGGEGESYFHKTRALIGSWRAAWGQGDFPFYVVQLANYRPDANTPAGGDGWAKVRCAQAKTLTIPNTGVATAIDIGETEDIHPKNKADVGLRLARWALAGVYGKTEIVPSGPVYKAMTIEGNKIRLTFDYVGGGLMVGKKVGRAATTEDAGGKLARFAIAGEDQQWAWADAVIDGSTVVVSSPQVPHPVAVRYAFTMNPLGANLYNRDGLPALPFRTDTW